VLAGLLVVGVISFYFVNTTLNSIQPVLANQSAGAGLAINTIHSGVYWDMGCSNSIVVYLHGCSLDLFFIYDRCASSVYCSLHNNLS